MSELDELSKFDEISSDFAGISELFVPIGRIGAADAPDRRPAIIRDDPSSRLCGSPGEQLGSGRRFASNRSGAYARPLPGNH
jgi:hypothetical protein